MKRYMLTTIFAMVIVGSFKIQAQNENGFVVWSKGGGCERELHYNTITDGDKVGEAKLVVPKGPGADIWAVISYDGEWIAWCRADMDKKWYHKYGKCDYHDFGNWEIYIARIDFGNILPAVPIHVANGYLPSWGDDAKTPNQPKTLYFTKYSDQTIQKTTINPDGSFTIPVEHSRCPKKMTGSTAHTQGSPDGKFILYRPTNMVVYSIEQQKDISGVLSGYGPSWGPRSKYFIQVNNKVFYNTGDTVKTLGSAGLGGYWHGVSNDAFWDEGRLWVIGSIGGRGQNGAGSVQFKPVDISGGGWKAGVGAGTEVGSGNSCDIHIFGPDGPTKPVGIDQMNGIGNRLTFSAEVYTGANGLQLVINSQKLAGTTAELYDLQGRRRVYIEVPKSFRTIMPLNGMANGRYVLQLNTDNVSAQKTVLISR